MNQINKQSPQSWIENEQQSIHLMIRQTIRHLEKRFRPLSDPLKSAISFYFFMEGRGHTALPISVEPESILLRIKDESFHPFLSLPLKKEQLKLEIEQLSTIEPFPFQIEEDQFLLSRTRQMELNVASYLHSRSELARSGHFQNRVDQLEQADWLSILFPNSDKTPEPLQATKQLIKTGFLVLTGGPGTGKTTTAGRILLSWIRIHRQIRETSQNSQNESVIQSSDSYQKPLRIALTAPTGKAASRLQTQVITTLTELGASPEEIEWIPKDSATLHRILYPYLRNEVLPDPSREEKIPFDLLVIDEASMLDLSLFHSLIQRISIKTDLLLIGDPNQLESVEPGAVFRDLCAGNLPKEIEIVTLTQGYRFNENSGIGALADDILKGIPSTVLLQDAKDLTLIDGDLGESVIDPLIEKIASKQFKVVSSKIDELLDFWNREIVLTPLRMTRFGSEYLNRAVQELISRKISVKIQNGWFQGKPFIITKNHFRLGVFNGDRGVCGRNEKGELSLFVESVDQIKELPLDAPIQTEASWFLTVHKSQGSEFDKVSLILPGQNHSLLTRQLLYTAVTRAREHFTLYGRASLLNEVISTQDQRFTALQRFLNKPEFS